MSVISKSEKQRLQSLKEKKQAFKIKGQLIQQALSNLDNAKNNKIIFDEDIGEQQNTKLEKKKIDLFDSDDDNNKNDVLWNENELDIKTDKRKQVILGSDARFTLDDRFTEDNHPIEKTKIITDIDKYDLQKEKEKQLDILESVLGTPFITKNQEKSDIRSSKKGLIIRYDPTENKHCEYEAKQVQPQAKEKDTRKKKRDQLMHEIEESAPVNVSKDIYYAVSDTLAQSLKQKEGFSLLKTYGKDHSHTEYAENNDISVTESKDKEFRFNFNAKNVFKCASSDEDVDEIPDTNKRMIREAKDAKNTCNLFGHKNTLFFDKDDVRFNEAVRFFNTEATVKDEFRNLRHELKLIVRTKIRKNEKRHQPWGKKRKIKKLLQ